jgi:hypothetical protein
MVKLKFIVYMSELLMYVLSFKTVSTENSPVASDRESEQAIEDNWLFSLSKYYTKLAAELLAVWGGLTWNQNNLVSIVTCYGLDGPGIESW